MSDLISREGLLKQIEIDSNEEPGYYGDTWKFIDTIKNMPSAQPEKHTKKRTETRACDLIDRQTAIDAILAVTGNSSVRELYEHVQEHELSDMWSGGVNAAIDVIIAVPSAQPDSKELSPTHKALDTISRQAAIRIVDGIDTWQAGWRGDAIESMKALPSAQPERKKGKWIPVTKIYKVTEGQFPNTHIEWVDATEPDEIDAVRCSECREVFDFQDARNWCTECGADMREDGATNADVES